MYFFFDYMYFRITQAFFKRDGRTGMTAIVMISVMQTFVILIVVIQPLIDYYLTEDERATNATTFSWIGIFAGLILILLNYLKYNGKYNKYRFHWKEESSNRRFFKGILVVICLVAPIIIYGIMGMK